MKLFSFKKFNIITIILLLSFILTGTVFAEQDFSRPMPEGVMQNKKMRPNMPPPPNGMMGKRPSPEEFERRLNLTEEQKAFAKEQREKSIEKIKPILNEIKTKEAQKEALKAKDASVEEINKLDNEIKELRKQTHEIRKANMKAFEATLTDTQRKELQTMKNEGRREFDKMQKKNKQQPFFNR